jgi:hypothetical protein
MIRSPHGGPTRRQDLGSIPRAAGPSDEARASVSVARDKLDGEIASLSHGGRPGIATHFVTGLFIARYLRTVRRREDVCERLGL